MNTQTIFMCVVALLIGMLVANMLQNVCGCSKIEGFSGSGGMGTSPDMSIIGKFIVDNQTGDDRQNACGGYYEFSNIPDSVAEQELEDTFCSQQDKSRQALQKFLKKSASFGEGCTALTNTDFDSSCQSIQSI